MRLVGFADLVPTRWKNGGGETREVAVHPPGAALDRFDWRVSMARVATDGPFSLFPEVDRTLAVLGGAGFDLAVGDGPPVRLTGTSAPHAFPADLPATARLVDGPVDDLNVMTRRGRFSHAVMVLALDRPLAIAAAGATAIAVCVAGEVRIGDARLRPRDALILDGDEARMIAPLGAPAQVLLVSIRAA